MSVVCLPDYTAGLECVQPYTDWVLHNATPFTHDCPVGVDSAAGEVDQIRSSKEGFSDDEHVIFLVSDARGALCSVLCGKCWNLNDTWKWY